jgi:hypothetical protein
MLKEFEDIVKGELPLPDGNTYGFVSELNTLQRDILSVLEVPLNYCVLSASVRWAKNFLKRAVRGRVAGFAASTLPSRIEAR